MSTAVADFNEAETEEIELTNIGPIAHELITLRPGGGVVIVKGDQGTGKSKTLEAVEAIATGKLTGLEKRDGSPRGEIRWGEALVSVIKRPTASGAELVCSTLEGAGFSLADLVDPQIKDPEKADAYRIKALVSLAGAEADLSLFHPLLSSPQEFAEVVSPEAGRLTDVVEMAGRVKRDLEASARKASDQAENLQGQALGHREAGQGYDATIETDTGRLQQAVEEAVREEQRLKSAIVNARQHNERLADVRRRLAEAEASQQTGRSLDSLRGELAALREHHERLDDEIARLRRELQAAETASSKTRSEIDHTSELIRGAEERETLLTHLRETAQRPEMREPGEELEVARSRVTEARQAIEQGALQRDKAERIRKAEEADRLAAAAKERHDRLRNAARATDEVLSGLVGRCTSDLRVERGRIVTTTDRGTELFTELSEGERWRLAYRIGVEALVRRGVARERMLIVLPQWAWGEWSPRTRRTIDQISREFCVHTLVAEATDDPEVFAEAFSG